MYVNIVRLLKYKGLHSKKYYLLFINDRIRFRWIYYILNRDFIAPTLRHFIYIIKT